MSLAGGRTHLEFVVSPDDAPVLAARLTAFGLPVSWRLRRGRGVVTSKNGEAVGTFLRRIGASGALLELEARHCLAFQAQSLSSERHAGQGSKYCSC